MFVASLYALYMSIYIYSIYMMTCFWWAVGKIFPTLHSRQRRHDAFMLDFLYIYMCDCRRRRRRCASSSSLQRESFVNIHTNWLILLYKYIYFYMSGGGPPHTVEARTRNNMNNCFSEQLNLHFTIVFAARILYNNMRL